MEPIQAATGCNQQTFEFHRLGNRRVEADFSGGHLSSDGGGLLLREVDRSLRLCERLAQCFTDWRDPDFVEHELPVLLRQRISAIALGYEDINDHDKLRLDPLLAAVCGRADVLGHQRHQTQDQGKPLAGKSTLNRLELGAQQINMRTKKIEAHPEKIEALLLKQGVQAIARKSQVSDSGFCRDELMRWIEAQSNVHYVFGLARNRRLEAMLAAAFWESAAQLDEDAVLCAKAAGAHAPPTLPGSARTFVELRYRTLESWSRERRVIGKAELTEGKHNPRFIVTDITGSEAWAREHTELADGRSLYEDFYCARGDAENRIKEQQLDMFADRTSTAHMSSNQLRLWFSTFAYTLMRELRASALQGTQLAKATVGTIRLQLMKIAAQISVSVRRVQVRLCSASPLQEVFAQAHAKLRAQSA